MFNLKESVKANKYKQVTSGSRRIALTKSQSKPKEVKPRQQTVRESASEEYAPESSTSEESGSEGSTSDESTSDSESEVPSSRKAKISEIKRPAPSTPSVLRSVQMSETTLEEPRISFHNPPLNQNDGTSTSETTLEEPKGSLANPPLNRNDETLTSEATLEEPEESLANLPLNQNDGTLTSEASTYGTPESKESSVSYVTNPEGNENDHEEVSNDITQFKTPPRYSQSPPSMDSSPEDLTIAQEPKFNLAKRSSSTFKKLKSGKDTLKKPRKQVIYELGKFRPVPASNISGSSSKDSSRTESTGWRWLCFGCLRKKKHRKVEFNDFTYYERYRGAN